MFVCEVGIFWQKLSENAELGSGGLKYFGLKCASLIYNVQKQSVVVLHPFLCCSSLGHLGSGRHVHAHPFEGLSLLVKGLVHILVWLLDHCAQGAVEELLLSVGSPGLSNWRVRSTHGHLVVLVFKLTAQVVSEVDFQVFVHESNVGKTELEVQVMVILDQVFNGQENGAESVLNDILTHLASGSNRNWVGVDHSETLLVDGVLGLWVDNLLLAVVTNCKGLQISIDDKTWPLK